MIIIPYIYEIYSSLVFVSTNVEEDWLVVYNIKETLMISNQEKNLTMKKGKSLKVTLGRKEIHWQINW